MGCCRLRGCCTGLRGCCTGLRGCCTGLRACCTNCTNCTGLAVAKTGAEIGDSYEFIQTKTLLLTVAKTGGLVSRTKLMED